MRKMSVGALSLVSAQTSQLDNFISQTSLLATRNIITKDQPAFPIRRLCQQLSRLLPKHCDIVINTVIRFPLWR